MRGNRKGGEVVRTWLLVPNETRAKAAGRGWQARGEAIGETRRSFLGRIDAVVFRNLF